MVGEDGELDRSVVESGELQRRVRTFAFARVPVEGLGVACDEVAADANAGLRRVDAHPSPRLAVADRRRELGSCQQLVEQVWLEWIGPEMSDVTTPREQRVEVLDERGVERRHRSRAAEKSGVRLPTNASTPSTPSAEPLLVEIA